MAKAKKFDHLKVSLTIDNMNITNKLEKFRTKNINSAKRGDHLNPLRVLSLSFVFPVDKYNKDWRITDHIGKREGTALISFAYEDIKLKKASSNALLYCKEKLDAFINNEDKTSISLKPSYTMDKAIMKICNDIFRNKAQAAEKSETTFINKYLMNFITEVILKDADSSIIYSMVDGAEDSSKKRPDFMLVLTNHKVCLYFFY
ncbi:MAG: hypothetical protein EXX96DRAFT_646198 [Benjaminiella poitrasii]|nr:MAG: hypothetical protein EXX96DRAFT_646198 [Benjaminiella poitrasii]